MHGRLRREVTVAGRRANWSAPKPHLHPALIARVLARGKRSTRARVARSQRTHLPSVRPDLLCPALASTPGNAARRTGLGASLHTELVLRVIPCACLAARSTLIAALAPWERKKAAVRVGGVGGGKMT